MADAIATALSIEHYIQYDNDALLAIADVYIGKGDKESALTTAETIANPSRKAAAIFKTATEYARDGDKNTAKAIAKRNQWKVAPILPLPDVEAASFDFANAETWAVTYDERPYGTMLSHSINVDRAEELAAAAMMLAQALDETHDTNYAVAFRDV